jgi:hypothetical protein
MGGSVKSATLGLVSFSYCHGFVTLSVLLTEVLGVGSDEVLVCR